MNKIYDTLIISGGGVRGINAIGSLQYLEDNNMLSNIKNYIGTSIGGVLLYLLIIGYKPIETFVYFCTSSCIDDLGVGDLVSLSNGDGFYNYDTSFGKFLKKATLDKVGKLLTLKDIKEIYNKNFYITTFNYSFLKEELLSHETHPDMPCLFALRLSCNLPIVFSRIKYLNCYYLDGGLKDCLPVKYLIETNVPIIINISDNVKNSDTKFNLLFYIYDLICLTSSTTLEQTINYIKEKKYLLISPESNLNAVNFKQSKTELLESFSKGYQSCKKKIEEEEINEIIKEELS